jgi:hypothetical protein
MDQFVCVRLVQAKALDLSLFQFDPDLTFAVFFLNADKTIYGRFGSRSDFEDADREISLEGLRKAMEAALALHADYPANQAALAGKTGPPPRYPTVADYPWPRNRPHFDHCVHCHHVQNAEQLVFRTADKPIPDEVLFPWPMPDVVGIELDPKERAKVEGVAPGSPADRSGFRAGDEIVTFEKQPVLSIADVQYVLQRAVPPAELQAEVRRRGKTLPLTLRLDKGWRRASNLSWRESSWDLRRMATGGLLLEELPEADRREAGLASDALSLRVKHMGGFGEHAAAKNAGFKVGDILVSVDGQTDRVRESELLAYLVQNRKRGDKVPVTLLRAGERLTLELPMQ